MSEYEDLFKDNINDSEFFSKKTNRVSGENPDDSDDYAQSKRNKSLFLVYIVTMLLVSVASSLIISSKYSDITKIVDNLTIITEPAISVSPSSDQDYPFEYSMSGSIKNDNEIILPVVYVEYYFYDASDEVISTYYIEINNLEPGAVFSFSEAVLFASDFSTTDYAYGFDEAPLFYLISNLSQVVIAGVAFLYIDKKAFRKDAKQVANRPGKAIKEILIGFFLVYVSMILAQLFMEYVLGVSLVSENESTIARMFVNEPLTLVLLFLLLCVFTPIVEEIVFRKVLCNFFEPRMGRVWAIVLSGAVFGLMHVIAFGDFVQSIPYVVMGLVFGYIYYRAEKNIFVPIGVHFLNNLISYLLYLLPLLGYSLL
jgi:membrane protease YdiL (CAAX protease family)